MRKILEVLMEQERLERLEILLLEWVEVSVEWVAMTKKETNSQ